MRWQFLGPISHLTEAGVGSWIRRLIELMSGLTFRSDPFMNGVLS